MNQGTGRKARVEHALRDVLTSLIASEVRDPRVRAATLLTVAKVEVNVDLAVANVYISVVGDDATADGVIAGLNKAAGFLRGPVARELSLQRAPELRFHHDVSIDVGAKLAAIVREDEERARAAGREPGQAEPTPASAPDPAATPGTGDPDDKEPT
ncbi:MAG: 30S ribosome-binding factor RbfA [Deltaproteobacteria bacterium]|nr:30S ribosome-binding factor RbfA [Deltaproteobacteria bacterium]MDQ3298651.1 30S ribosome-binding factor RbfA [Myxococcota bacterium]